MGSNGNRRRSGTVRTLPTRGAGPTQSDPALDTPACGQYDAGVEVVIAPTAREYIEEHGGTVFVRSHRHRCCTGSLTLLDSTTTPPEDASNFLSFDTGGIGVRFLGGPGGMPNQLTIELRGLLNRHPVAFWDGCAFKP
jgi:hypothetical protein